MRRNILGFCIALSVVMGPLGCKKDAKKQNSALSSKVAPKEACLPGWEPSAKELVGRIESCAHWERSMQGKGDIVAARLALTGQAAKAAWLEKSTWFEGAGNKKASFAVGKALGKSGEQSLKNAIVAARTSLGAKGRSAQVVDWQMDDKGEASALLVHHAAAVTEHRRGLLNKRKAFNRLVNYQSVSVEAPWRVFGENVEARNKNLQKWFSEAAGSKDAKVLQVHAMKFAVAKRHKKPPSWIEKRSWQVQGRKNIWFAVGKVAKRLRSPSELLTLAHRLASRELVAALGRTENRAALVDKTQRSKVKLVEVDWYESAKEFYLLGAYSKQLRRAP